MEKFPLLISATNLAFEAHKDQRRKGTGLPYFCHLSDVTGRVAHYLLEMDEIAINMSKDELLAACMLHDYIEDQDGKYEDIKDQFGKNVADVVLECSRDPEKESTLGKFEFLETFRNKSFASSILKLSDRYCNVNDYLRTPYKSVYASKYALQAYPVYKKILLNSNLSASGINLIWQTLVKDIRELNEIIQRVYNFNIFTPTDQTQLVKELVV